MALKVPKSNNLQLFKDGYKVRDKKIHVSPLRLTYGEASTRP